MRLTTSLALLALASPAVAQVARPSTQVDTTTFPRSFQGGVSGYAGQATVVWKDSTQGIYASSSDDSGQTWSTATRVDMDGGLMTSKFLAFGTAEPVQVNGDHVYAIWEDVRDGVTNEIWFNRSTDGGATFESSDQMVSESALMGYVWTLDQAMAIVRDADPDNDQIHIIYSPEDGLTPHCDPNDPTAGPEDIFYRGSVDGGASFGSSILLTSVSGSGADVDEIAICADGDNVYAAWVDSRDGCFDDVYFAFSDDNGFTWSTDFALETTGAGNASGLTMDCDGLNVVVGWQDQPGVTTGPQEAHLVVSTDGGNSFSADQIVGNYIPGTDDVDDFKVAYSFGNVVYAIVHDGSGSNEVYASSSSDAGATFAAETQLTVGGGSFPRITEGSAEVAVAWSGGAFPNPVESAFSVDGGVTWSGIVTVNDTPLSDTDFTEIGYDPIERNVLVAWLDDQDNGAGAFDNNNNVELVGGYSIGGPATATLRNAGTNPVSYTATPPVLGDVFTGTLNVGSTGHSFGLIVGYGSALSFPTSFGVLLVNPVDPGGELLGALTTAGPIATFNLTVPISPSLAGLPVSTQGLHIGGAPIQLSNAQDLVIGGF